MFIVPNKVYFGNLENYNKDSAKAEPKFFQCDTPIAPISRSPYDCSKVTELMPFLLEKYTLAVFFFYFAALNTQWSYLKVDIKFDKIFGIILPNK